MAYDVVIHTSFYDEIQKSEFFMEFFIELVFCGLEEKYGTLLSRDYTKLKNRKAVGTLQLQNVRSKSAPVIMEMDSNMYELEKDIIGKC